MRNYKFVPRILVVEAVVRFPSNEDKALVGYRTGRFSGDGGPLHHVEVDPRLPKSIFQQVNHIYWMTVNFQHYASSACNSADFVEVLGGHPNALRVSPRSSHRSSSAMSSCFRKFSRAFRSRSVHWRANAATARRPEAFNSLTSTERRVRSTAARSRANSLFFNPRFLRNPMTFSM